MNKIEMYMAWGFIIDARGVVTDPYSGAEVDCIVEAQVSACAEQQSGSANDSANGLRP